MVFPDRSCASVFLSKRRTSTGTSSWVRRFCSACRTAPCSRRRRDNSAWGGNYYAANHNDQNAAFIFPKQAYVRFKNEHSGLQMGRFEFVDGTEVTRKDPTLATLIRDRISHRLIGTFAFADVQRSVDGLRYSYNNGPWNFTAVSAAPDRGVFQVDGWGWVVTPFSYVSATPPEQILGTAWRIGGCLAFTITTTAASLRPITVRPPPRPRT